MEIDFQNINLGIQPQVLGAIIKLDPNNSNLDFGQLEKIIRADQSVTMTILKVANSNFFAHGSEIKTLQHSISVLGFKTIRSLAMIASSRSIFGTNTYSRFKEYVWKPSIATSLIARAIASKVGFKASVDECFIMGLLHRLGQAVLNAVDKKKFTEVLNLIQSSKKSFSFAEKEVFGNDHIEVGSKAAENWGMPKIYRYAIQYYSCVDNMNGAIDETSKKLVYILAMANYIANKNGFGNEADIIESNFHHASTQVGLSEEELLYFTKDYPENLMKSDDYKYYVGML